MRVMTLQLSRGKQLRQSNKNWTYLVMLLGGLNELLHANLVAQSLAPRCLTNAVFSCYHYCFYWRPSSGFYHLQDQVQASNEVSNSSHCPAPVGISTFIFLISTLHPTLKPYGTTVIAEGFICCCMSPGFAKVVLLPEHLPSFNLKDRLQFGLLFKDFPDSFLQQMFSRVCNVAAVSKWV